MQTHPLFSNDSTASQTNWLMVSDQVMGGKSQGSIQMTEAGVTMQGQVSLENNGGFLQIQWPISNSVPASDLQNYRGVFIEWCAQQNETLELLLKSTQLWMPWQSYRYKANVTTQWQTIYVPFEAFEPFRTRTALKPQRITKFAVLAGGKAISVNVTIRKFGLYSD